MTNFDIIQKTLLATEDTAQANLRIIIVVSAQLKKSYFRDNVFLCKLFFTSFRKRKLERNYVLFSICETSHKKHLLDCVVNIRLNNLFYKFVNEKVAFAS